jgi:hypothetical protein
MLSAASTLVGRIAIFTPIETFAGLLNRPCSDSGGAFEDQGQRDLAAFAHQHVIGAAGGAVVHAFHADVPARQAGDQAWVHEALARAGAEDDDVRRILRQFIEVGGGELVESVTFQGRGGTSGSSVRL